MKSRVLLFLVFFLAVGAGSAGAADISFPTIHLGVQQAKTPQDVVLSLQILLILTVLSLAPAILIMMTSFTRIIIILSFLRQGLGTQQVPPNQVLMGLALFLTFFTMHPTFEQIDKQALTPYLQGQLSTPDAFRKAQVPLRQFMFKETREKDLALFVALSKSSRPRTPDDVSTWVLVPAFVISELKKAFEMGFVIFIPFLIIDMVTASVLMSMGMMMLPPVLISLPFKILLFVMVDGWNLIVRSIALSF
ncbi:MAG: flagellar type III secretion system pore protein FliP [bacterium]